MFNWKENYEYRKSYLNITVTHSCDIGENYEM